MKVLFVAAECKPYSKQGGVADVAGELPVALKREGVDVTIATPLYGCVDRTKHKLTKDTSFKFPYERKEREVTVWRGDLKGVPVMLLENPENFTEGPYVHSNDFPFKDDARRFSFFSRALIPLMKEYDIVHGNDWMAGYMFGMMVNRGLTQKRIMTVHNIGYQGNIAADRISGWEIEAILHSDIGGMFYCPFTKCVNPMKLALELSHISNAVSKTYAREILAPPDENRFFQGGSGLQGICSKLDAEDRLVGIINGYEYSSEPSEEGFKNILARKAALKQRLAGYFKSPHNVLVGFVGRAVDQKFKLLTENIRGKTTLEHILDIPGVNVAVLATGLAHYEAFLTNIGMRRHNGAKSYDDSIWQSRRKNYVSFCGFDKEMAEAISLGSDLFLMPSVYEPCGITQLQAMSNATPPIVRWTGGLCDTVRAHYHQDGTGFGFDGRTREELLNNLVYIVREASSAKPEEIRRIQKNAYDTRFRWADAAKEYIEMYKIAMKHEQ